MKTKLIDKNIDYIAIIIAIIPFFFGLFYDFTIFLITAIMQIAILVIYIKKRELTIKIDSRLILLVIFTVCAGLTIIWGVDSFDSMLGFI